MKILMIGNKESGKTTYMASSFGMMNNGREGFYISTDANTKEWYSRLFQTIRNGGYPSATSKRGSYQFKLRYLGQEVLDFEWIDYNGGIIRELNADKFMEDIKEADGVMLFFDALALYEGRASISQLRRILTLLTQKLGTIESPLFSVIMVVTKVDTLNSVDQYEQAISPLNDFLSSVEDNNRIYARVVPVSCTQNGFYNVELPLLDMLDSGLKVSYLSALQTATACSQQAVNYNKRRSVFDWVYSRWNGFNTNGEIAEQFAKRAREQIELFESIEKPVSRLSDYVATYEITLPLGQRSYGRAKSKRNTARNMIEF